MMLFEVGVRMERTLESGKVAKVVEQFVDDALSFTEAETRIISEVGAYGTDIEVVTMKRSRCTELVGDGSKEKWFKAKVNYITVNEKTGKERKTPYYYFVNAETIADAKSTVDDFFRETIIDYSIATLDETKVLDVSATI
uniref:Uncharacterized protein n=1 Tax=Podoviridae sp. ctDwO1 TaxID=2827726 RepID=A0A8S5TAN7_9CAUD|nr:MAG TPA: protein of unknown function (DUF4494) [Podoviridae sp. ctDwO1]